MTEGIDVHGVARKHQRRFCEPLAVLLKQVVTSSAVMVFWQSRPWSRDPCLRSDWFERSGGSRRGVATLELREFDLRLRP